MRFEKVKVETSLENLGILLAKEEAEAEVEDEVEDPFSEEEVLIIVNRQSRYRLIL